MEFTTKAAVEPEDRCKPAVDACHFPGFLFAYCHVLDDVEAFLDEWA